jgi:hypothetical protein
MRPCVMPPILQNGAEILLKLEIFNGAARINVNIVVIEGNECEDNQGSPSREIGNGSWKLCKEWMPYDLDRHCL